MQVRQWNDVDSLKVCKDYVAVISLFLLSVVAYLIVDLELQFRIWRGLLSEPLGRTRTTQVPTAEIIAGRDRIKSKRKQLGWNRETRNNIDNL